MYRNTLPTVLFVLAATLLWPQPVAAQDPDPNTCLPACYAYNYPNPSEIPSTRDGTERLPWLWDKTSDPNANSLRQKVEDAVKHKRDSGTLLVIDCTGESLSCTATLYTFRRDGTQRSEDQGPVPVPDVGVPLPFHYILVGILLLGILLIGAGVVLRRRTRRQSLS